MIIRINHWNRFMWNNEKKAKQSFQFIFSFRSSARGSTCSSFFYLLIRIFFKSGKILLTNLLIYEQCFSFNDNIQWSTNSFLYRSKIIQPFQIIFSINNSFLIYKKPVYIFQFSIYSPENEYYISQMSISLHSRTWHWIRALENPIGKAYVAICHAISTQFLIVTRF